MIPPTNQIELCLQAMQTLGLALAKFVKILGDRYPTVHIESEQRLEVSFLVQSLTPTEMQSCQ